MRGLNLDLGLGLTKPKPVTDEGGGGGGYVGPLDIVGEAVVAYGQRRLSSAWSSDVFTLKRATDNADLSFAALESGDVDVAAITAWTGSGLRLVDAAYSGEVGSGYDDGTYDLTISGGTFTSPAKINVTAEFGVISTINGISDPGNYTVVPDVTVHLATDDAHGGTGFTILGDFGKATLVTVNDQSGNGFNTIRFDNQFPIWDIINASSKPGFGRGLNPLMEVYPGGAPWAATESLTSFIVAYIDAQDTGQEFFPSITDDDGTGFLGIVTAGQFKFRINGSSTTIWSSPNSDFTGLHIFEMTCDASGNVKLYLDGVDQGATVTSGSLQPLPELVTLPFGINYELPVPNDGPVKSMFYEGIVWHAVSDADRLSVRQNMADYYGITLP